jgi:hypothetical protein
MSLLGAEDVNMLSSRLTPLLWFLMQGSSQFPYRHYLACHPAGAVINFNVNAGGATSWFHVIEGEVVGAQVLVC